MGDQLAKRYMGKANAEAYGRRNSTEGVLVRIKPTRREMIVNLLTFSFVNW